MNSPTSTTSTTTAPTTGAPAAPSDTTAENTAESIRMELDALRQRAIDLHQAADRAESIRYTERGGALDDATRAAATARQEADSALQQAQRERAAARQFEQDAEDLTAEGNRPGADLRWAQQMVERNRVLARAADERAERLERSAEQQAARAGELAQQVAELQQAADDGSISLELRSAAGQMEYAVDQLQEKHRLLEAAESLEQDAADLEARGDSLSAELYREQVADVRARAEAIQPEVPEVDPRILRAANVAWADEVDEVTEPTPENTGVVPPHLRDGADAATDPVADPVDPIDPASSGAPVTAPTTSPEPNVSVPAVDDPLGAELYHEAHGMAQPPDDADTTAGPLVDDLAYTDAYGGADLGGAHGDAGDGSAHGSYVDPSEQGDHGDAGRYGDPSDLGDTGPGDEYGDPYGDAGHGDSHGDAYGDNGDSYEESYDDSYSDEPFDDDAYGDVPTTY